MFKPKTVPQKVIGFKPKNKHKFLGLKLKLNLKNFLNFNSQNIP